MAKVLVVGGAGYVGSATCARLVDQGHTVWVLDDLTTGYRDLLVPGIAGFTQGKVGDSAVVLALLQQERFDCVMHFAARSLVGESVLKPAEYFENNVTQTRHLLEAMARVGVRRFIFSSTCAIFGDPGTARIHEGLPKRPINPYGETKLKAEETMQEFARDQGLQVIALRYFNACGAEPKIRVGEKHDPETHLIPRVLQAAAAGVPVEVFGTDYPTPDGTCVRDYIHVWDLAAAHLTAMERLLAKSGSGSFEAFNLGSENGYSVREVIEACRKVTGLDLKIVEKDRRPGDPPMLVADSALARKELAFKIEWGLESIIETAWLWERKRRGLLAKAVFLDRDGTINEDPGYLSQPEQLKLLPGTGEALAQLRRAGFQLVVVSNQSGVGRGLIEAKMLPLIHDRLQELLKPWSVRVDHFELCFHHPNEECACRKPKPKLLLDAAYRLGVDLSRSYMVGDKESDLNAGKNAGCKASVLVKTGEGAKVAGKLAPGEADFIGASLLEAAHWILAQESASS